MRALKLHSQIIGHGEPIVLLHGLFGSGSNLRSLARSLTDHYCCHLPDLRNHGLSPHSPMMDYPAMAADVIHYMDSHNLRSAHLLGHSMGGKVAMQAALNDGGRVKKLLVVDIAPVKYPARHNDVLEGLAAINLQDVKSLADADGQLAAYVGEKPLRNFLLTNLKRNASGKYQWLPNLQAIKQQYHCIADGITGTPFGGETLFIKGSQSDYLAASHRDYVTSLFPNAKTRIIANAGHWLHTEKPQIFNRMVARFLAPE
jgi:esterase